jgi:HPt (histidine-containing phosphotransfer) domain-containing protein
VATLETAAASLAAGTLQPEQAEAAHSAAHKLSGALGSFGLTRGTELARELEAAYAPNAAPEPAAAPRLAGITAELKAIVRDRK